MTELTSPPATSRRHFLKLSATGVGLLLAAPLVFSSADYAAVLTQNKKIYRGTFDGRILVSMNNGQSWQQVVDFGKKYTITKITADEQGIVSVNLTDQHLNFWVHSKNDVHWMTDNYA
jgi:hypothetical protein